MQFGPDDLDDPMAALANLKRTGTVSEYHKSFIKLAYLEDDSEKNLISLRAERGFESEGETGQASNHGGSIQGCCARELIAITEKKLGKFQPYRGTNRGVQFGFCQF